MANARSGVVHTGSARPCPQSAHGTSIVGRLLIRRSDHTEVSRFARRRTSSSGRRHVRAQRAEGTDHAAPVLCWFSIAAIFRQRSILRNVICPLATRVKRRIKAASSIGSDQSSQQVLLGSPRRPFNLSIISANISTTSQGSDRAASARPGWPAPCSRVTLPSYSVGSPTVSMPWLIFAGCSKTAARRPGLDACHRDKRPYFVAFAEAAVLAHRVHFALGTMSRRSGETYRPDPR